jgi:hypothetical protein
MRRVDPSAQAEHRVPPFVWEIASGASPRGRLGTALVLGAVLVALGPDRLARMPPFCPISAIIRRPCPGCGMTRAAAALLRGDLRRAVRTNPRIVPVAVTTLALLGRDVWIILPRAAHR